MSQLADQFRDAKFVHLFRDGRECAYSFSRHPAYRLGAVSAMLESRLGMSPYMGDDEPPEQVPPDLRPFMPGTFDPAAIFMKCPSPARPAGKLGARDVRPLSVRGIQRFLPNGQWCMPTASARPRGRVQGQMSW
jgi:hypothetical protein